jgi:N-ethylmaleimide reductase
LKSFLHNTFNLHFVDFEIQNNIFSLSTRRFFGIRPSSIETNSIHHRPFVFLDLLKMLVEIFLVFPHLTEKGKPHKEKKRLSNSPITAIIRNIERRIMAIATPTMQLLSKFTIGGRGDNSDADDAFLELSNRIVLAPMTRARCDPGTDVPNEIMVEYYTQRASAGLLITEGTQISQEAMGWANAPSITTEQHVNAWKKVVDAVHDKGGKIFLQLWHLGRQSHSSFHPTTNDIVSASAIRISNGSTARNKNGESVAWEVPRALTVDEIKVTVNDYVQAARLAKQAGFDGVEVHGANGYIVDQFLQTCSNTRTDEYGGSMENRYRFLQEIVEGIINADGAFPASRVGVRLSPNG